LEDRRLKAPFKVVLHLGRVVFANNSIRKEDFNGNARLERLAEWDGKTWKFWKKRFKEYGCRAFGSPYDGNGWDGGSAILKVLIMVEWLKVTLPNPVML